MPYESENFVFDPSLLHINSIPLFEALLDADVEVRLTHHMSDVLKDSYWLEDLLTLWDFPPEESRAVTRAFAGTGLATRFRQKEADESGKAVDEVLRDMILRRVTRRRHLVDFFLDELKLAINGDPILSTHDSQSRTVEFLRRMGLRIKEDVKTYWTEKVQRLKLKNIKRMILSDVTRLYLVHLVAGTPALIALGGGMAIQVLVEDP
jgi:hypothetical protein